MLADTLRPAFTKTTEFDFETYAKMKPNSTIIQKRFVHYSYDENGNRSVVKHSLTQKNTVSLSNLAIGAAGQYNGYMSPATRRKVNGIIQNYLEAVQLNTSMKFPSSFPSQEVYPTFLTLTLPADQLHCDNLIKKNCFFRFIEWLTGDKEKGASGWGVKNYIWVAETQKNGRIHFHMIIDRALPADRINRKWNQILERLGYVTFFKMDQTDKYKNGWFVDKEQMKHRLADKQKECRANGKSFNRADSVNEEKKRQLEAYKRGAANNWNNPPSTKIHSIQNIRKLSAYVSKYMTKAPEVNIKLSEGEKLVEENGKFFIETQQVEYSISHEGNDLETHKEPERRPVKVDFRNRYIRGRVWGASQLLHSDNLNPYTVALETNSMVTTTTYDYRTVTISKPAYTENMFGERVFSHMQKVEKVNVITESRREIAPAVVDYDASRIIEFLKSGYVPQKDIDKATARAGEFFARAGGEIIPLEHPQKDVLRAYSPKMYERYADHYKTMFIILYPN